MVKQNELELDQQCVHKSRRKGQRLVKVERRYD